MNDVKRSRGRNQGDPARGEDHGVGSRGRDDDRDAGVYIGNRPEMARDTIPGGVERRDRRVAATNTQPAARRDHRDDAPGTPAAEPAEQPR